MAGAALGETVFRGLIFNDLKLMVDEPPLQPPRIPAVLQFAADRPLEVSLDEDTVSVAVRLMACRRDQVPVAIPPTQVRIAYRLAFGPAGLTVTRGRMEVAPAADGNPAFRDVLDRFFPQTLRSKPRFQNAGFEQGLTLSRVRVRDGWLCLGLTRSEKAPAPPGPMPQPGSP